MSQSTLFVFAHLDADFVPAGTLYLTESGAQVDASAFAYGTKYIERANAVEVDPLSLSLTNKHEIRGRRLFPVNNGVFFGGIRDAAPDSWGRRVIEAKLKAPANSLPESRYLLEAGGNRIGALDIRTSLNAAPAHAQSSVTDLAYLLEAAERIEAGLPVPQHLESIFDSGTALGGARAKATVRDEDGILWLAKFRSRGETLDVPAIEAATLDLGRQCGLSVPDLKMTEVSGRSVMLIRRFDRYWAEPGVLPGSDEDFFSARPARSLIEKRVPFVSGLTLLGCDEFTAREKSYGELAQAIRKYCHPSLIRANNRELFGRMVFNIFVNNDDDHLRNHGFLWHPGMKGWGLSPLYDVMPRPTLASERNLFLGVGEMGRAATLDNAMSAYPAFSLSAAEAAAIIGGVWEKVREWRVYFEQFGVAAQTMEQAASAFRHIDAISSVALRAKLP